MRGLYPLTTLGNLTLTAYNPGLSEAGSPVPENDARFDVPWASRASRVD